MAAVGFYRVGRALVLLDEAHLLHDWARRLKGRWDDVRRRRLPIHVIATGSSALRLAAGSHESLAGRFERVTLGHWDARSLGAAFGLDEHSAAEEVVRRGGYPGAFEYRDNPLRWHAYVRDAIIELAIGRDLMALAQVRRPGILRQVFGVCVDSPARIVTLQKLQGQLQDRGALETISHYLALLEEAFLVAPLAKFARTATRQRAAPPKLVTLSNALLAASRPHGLAGDIDGERWGAWVENACLAHAWNAGQHVTYWREAPLEVDGVLDGDWGRWAIEVKTGAVRAGDLTGLLEFTRRHQAYRPLLVCEPDQHRAAESLGVGWINWRRFLLDGPAGAQSPSR